MGVASRVGIGIEEGKQMGDLGWKNDEMASVDGSVSELVSKGVLFSSMDHPSVGAVASDSGLLRSGVGMLSGGNASSVLSVGNVSGRSGSLW